MGRKLSAAEHEAKAIRAWELSVQGKTQPAIAAELGVSRQTVNAMIAEQRTAYAESIAGDRITYIAEFTAEQRALMDVSYRYGTDEDESNTSRSAHLANFGTASERIAKARGLFIEKKALADANGDIVDPLEGLRAILGVSR